MSKISITNGKITSIEPYGNGVLLETTPGAVVIVNGLAAATPSDIRQAMSIEVANDQPVGPRDLFTYSIVVAQKAQEGTAALSTSGTMLKSFSDATI